MEATTYKTKSGATQFRPIMSTEEYSEATFGLDSPGFCLACGADAYGVEPDARKYECEACGAPKVYGLEELLLMGLVKFDA